MAGEELTIDDLVVKELRDFVMAKAGLELVDQNQDVTALPLPYATFDPIDSYKAIVSDLVDNEPFDMTYSIQVTTEDRSTSVEIARRLMRLLKQHNSHEGFDSFVVVSADSLKEIPVFLQDQLERVAKFALVVGVKEIQIDEFNTIETVGIPENTGE